MLPCDLREQDIVEGKAWHGSMRQLTCIQVDKKAEMLVHSWLSIPLWFFSSVWDPSPQDEATYIQSGLSPPIKSSLDTPS